MPLTSIPTPAPMRHWHNAAVLCLRSDAYDHPDHDMLRAALAEIAALEDRLRQMAAEARRPGAFNDAANGLTDIADHITDEAWRWEDDRDNREANDRRGAALDARRGLGER